MGTANIFLHSGTGSPIAARGNADGTIAMSESIYQSYIDEVDANNTYVGEAVVGTLTSAVGWRIKKIVIAGTITSIKYADGVDTFTKIWDNRATYIY